MQAYMGLQIGLSPDLKTLSKIMPIKNKAFMSGWATVPPGEYESWGWRQTRLG